MSEGVRAIDLFDAGARVHPNSPCLVSDGIALDYREVSAWTMRIANAIARAGCTPGTKAAVLSANDPFAFVCILALLRAGLVWLPLNPRNALEENLLLLDGFDCELLFVGREFAESVVTIRAKVPRIRAVVCIGTTHLSVPSLAEWAGREPDTFSLPGIGSDDLAAISATGGTTGRAKGVCMTQRNIVAFSRGCRAMLADDHPTVYLAAAPMTHVGGRLCFPVVEDGGVIVVLPRADPEAILDAIEQHRVSRLFLPPTVIYALLDHPGIERRDFSSLRYFMYGAAPMSVEQLKRALRVFGPVMQQGYGQTEAPLLIASLRREDHFADGVLHGVVADDHRLSSCGRATSFVEVAIMDPGGRPQADEVHGEIAVKGEIVMRGYYRDEAATAEVLRGGWLYTGDIGYRDREGFLHIVDRRKDMIISGGFNVYSTEVEQAILSLPGVRDCAVIGVPDERWGEVVKALVQPVAGAVLDPAEMIKTLRPQLGGVKTPKSIELRDDLPRSPAGKVLKRVLRDAYWKGHARKI